MTGRNILRLVISMLLFVTLNYFYWKKIEVLIIEREEIKAQILYIGAVMTNFVLSMGVIGALFRKKDNIRTK